jgi:chromosome segregation ATPase
MATQQQHSASNPSSTRDEKAVIENQDQDLKTQKTKVDSKPESNPQPESLEAKLEEIRVELSGLKASMNVLLAKVEPKNRNVKTKATENEDADPVGTQAVPLSQQIRDLVEDLQDRQAKLKSGVEHQVQDQPIATLGMAFGLGMVISRLMRGRK